jgi:hypothetical protein
LTYIEHEDKSAYTVYKIVRHAQPALLKQVVALVALHTVNLPFQLVDDLTVATKGHGIAKFSPPLGPARNIVQYDADPKVAGSRPILLMNTGTPKHPRFSVKYKSDTGPNSAVIVTETLMGFFNYVQNSGKRGQSISELQKQLRMTMQTEYGPEVNMCVVACLAELCRCSIDYGAMPNIVYYDVRDFAEQNGLPLTDANSSDAQGPAVDPALPGQIERGARAVLAAPSITLENNPGAMLTDAEAGKVYKETRLVGLRNETEPPKQHADLARFVNAQFYRWIENKTGIKKGSLMLCSREDIIAVRTRPAQRARAETWGRLGETEEEAAACFLKWEAMHKFKKPRGITQLEFMLSIDTGRLGKFMKEILSGLDGFNPGDSPETIAETIRALVLLGHEAAQATNADDPKGGSRGLGAASGVCAGDYTAMDETHSKFTNTFPRGLIEYFIHPQDRDLALDIFDRAFNIDAVIDVATGAGAKKRAKKESFCTFWKNVSGSGMTTELNTFVAMSRQAQKVFICLLFPYLSHADRGGIARSVERSADGGYAYELHVLKDFRRAMKAATEDDKFKRFLLPEDNGFIVNLALRYIGNHFGDDGLDPAVPYVTDETSTLVDAYLSRLDGMKVVTEYSCTVPGNEEPVEYLSRVYPAPQSSAVSFCKVTRALDKLTIALNGDRDRYCLKVQGYWTVDSRTPVVRDYLRAIAQMYGFELKAIEGDKQLAMLYASDRDLYYKVIGGNAGVDAEADEAACHDAIALQLGMTGNELENYCTGLSKEKSWEGIKQFALPDVTLNGARRQADPPGTYRTVAASGAERLADVEAEPGASADVDHSNVAVDEVADASA